MDIQIKNTIEGKASVIVEDNHLYSSNTSWRTSISLWEIMDELKLSDGEYEVEFKITKQQ